MDLTLGIDTENQHQIQLKLIHNINILSTSKELSQLLSLVKNLKATDQKIKFS